MIMNANIAELQKKPLFSLTVEEFIAIQQTVVNIPPPVTEQSKFLGIEEAILLTGYKKSTLYRKTCMGTIPFIKRGAKILFIREELENWILENRKESEAQSVEEIENRFYQNAKKRNK